MTSRAADALEALGSLDHLQAAIDANCTHSVAGEAAAMQVATARTVWTTSADGSISIRGIPVANDLRVITPKAPSIVVRCLLLVSGNMMWAGLSDGFIRVFDSNSARLINEFKQHSGAVNTLVGGVGRVFSAGDDFKIFQWNPKTFEYQRMFAGHTLPVKCLCIFATDANVTLLVSGSADSTLRLWNVLVRSSVHADDEDPCAHILRGHKQSVLALVHIPKLQHLWSGAEDSTLRVWCTRTFQCLSILEGHKAPVTAVAHVDRRVWSGGKDGAIIMWDAFSLAPVRKLTDSTSPANRPRYVMSIKRVQQVPMWRVWTSTNDGLITCWLADGSSSVTNGDLKDGSTAEALVPKSFAEKEIASLTESYNRDRSHLAKLNEEMANRMEQSERHAAENLRTVNQQHSEVLRLAADSHAEEIEALERKLRESVSKASDDAKRLSRQEQELSGRLADEQAVVSELQTTLESERREAQLRLSEARKQAEREQHDALKAAAAAHAEEIEALERKLRESASKASDDAKRLSRQEQELSGRLADEQAVVSTLHGSMLALIADSEASQRILLFMTEASNYDMLLSLAISARTVGEKLEELSCARSRIERLESDLADLKSRDEALRQSVVDGNASLVEHSTMLKQLTLELSEVSEARDALVSKVLALEQERDALTNSLASAHTLASDGVNRADGLRKELDAVCNLVSDFGERFGVLGSPGNVLSVLSDELVALRASTAKVVQLSAELDVIRQQLRNDIVGDDDEEYEYAAPPEDVPNSDADRAATLLHCSIVLLSDELRRVLLCSSDCDRKLAMLRAKVSSLNEDKKAMADTILDAKNTNARLKEIIETDVDQLKKTRWALLENSRYTYGATETSLVLLREMLPVFFDLKQREPNAYDFLAVRINPLVENTKTVFSRLEQLLMKCSTEEERAQLSIGC